MQLNDNFPKLFGKKPIIGMIHLTGVETTKVNRALEELEIYENCGLDGVIVENFYGGPEYLVRVLDKIAVRGTEICIGVNFLPDRFWHSFTFADMYGADFIQMDYISGRYRGGKNIRELNPNLYDPMKEIFPDIVVMGGVWPKYYHPVEGSVLEKDLKKGITRSEVIVVTGEETGVETPIEKIIEFREIIGDKPLIVGAGLNLDNVQEQLSIADGGIVGSFFKVGGIARKKIDESKVKEFMSAVREIT
jgi:uncharacterized protein